MFKEKKQCKCGIGQSIGSQKNTKQRLKPETIYHGKSAPDTIKYHGVRFSLTEHLSVKKLWVYFTTICKIFKTLLSP